MENDTAEVEPLDDALQRAWRQHLTMRHRPAEHRYRRFQIPKRADDPSAGFRDIASPDEELRVMQRRIVRMLDLLPLAPSDAAHAYRHGRSIRTMAEPHVRARWMVKIDLRHFFPGISPAHLFRELLRGRLRTAVPAALVQLIGAWCFLDGGLPMGGPSSPALSNIAACGLDRRMRGLARRWSKGSVDAVAYTRYCDDFVLSSDTQNVKFALPFVRRIVEDCGFEVNNDKVRVYGPRSRRIVCGVSTATVIGAPGAWRNSVLRCGLFNRCRDAARGARVEDAEMAVWRGRVAHATNLNPEQTRALRAAVDRLARLRGPRETWPGDVVAWAARWTPS